LLMKCYLNKGAFVNRQTPTFDAADMQQVITIGQSIMSGGKYSFTSDYFDNFGANNTVSSKEAIFSYLNTPGASNNSNVNARWKMTLHYNSWDKELGGAGWNGFSTLSDFYNLFGATDRRIGGSYPGVTDVSGLKVGFLIGQQYYENGAKAYDRKGNPLNFTAAVQLQETDPVAIENAGIRVIKYPPDYAHYDGSAGNDLMFYRYSDVVLMVAEAQLRTGDAADALLNVNKLRISRGAVPLASINLDGMLAERGREFYWESMRRTDLIRFGKFLTPWQLKPTDDPKYLYFPIPNSALAVNPNLKQNPGY
ncbi:MAG TPA: RagB/SusD family nutrient uptake outer membrane protein, partial [Chitinophagaceae bacterium]